MRKTLQCPKCSSKNIVKTSIGFGKGLSYSIQTGAIGGIVIPTAYICGECGYLENYIENQKKLEKVINTFK